VTRGTAVTLVGRFVLVALSAILTIMTSRALGSSAARCTRNAANAIVLARRASLAPVSDRQPHTLRPAARPRGAGSQQSCS